MNIFIPIHVTEIPFAQLTSRFFAEETVSLESPPSHAEKNNLGEILSHVLPEEKTGHEHRSNEQVRKFVFMWHVAMKILFQWQIIVWKAFFCFGEIATLCYKLCIENKRPFNASLISCIGALDKKYKMLLFCWSVMQVRILCGTMIFASKPDSMEQTKNRPSKYNNSKSTT